MALGRLRCPVSGRGLDSYCRRPHSYRQQLVLTTFGGGFRFTGNWKDTYLRTKCGCDARHTPLQIRDCFSDALHDPWIGAALQLDPRWLKVENVDRCTGLSVEDFIVRYEVRARILWADFRALNTLHQVVAT